jgi:hypothetical protein
MVTGSKMPAGFTAAHTDNSPIAAMMDAQGGSSACSSS